MNWSQESYSRAFSFAAHAHGAQACPGTGYPYIWHLAMVCMEVMASFPHARGVDEELAIQCALLHDTLEDTPATEAELRREFGPGVAAGVRALTKDPAVEKERRMAECLDRILRAPVEIAMVKLADRIVNLLPPPASWGSGKIIEYHGESLAILDALGEKNLFLAARLRDRAATYVCSCR